MDRTPPIELQSDALILTVAHGVLSKAATSKAVDELGPIAEAYACAFEVVASAAKRSLGQFSEATPDSSNRDSIFAGYIAGLTLVEHAILGGFNPQAAALVRQEFEAIAALAELREGKRADGRTPQVRRVPSVPPTIYGDLSNAAHFSHSSSLRKLTSHQGEIENAPGPTAVSLISPQHIPGVTDRMFAVHIVLLLNLAEHLAEHNQACHGLESTEEELDNFNRALRLLRDAGAIEDAQ